MGLVLEFALVVDQRAENSGPYICAPPEISRLRICGSPVNPQAAIGPVPEHGV